MAKAQARNMQGDSQAVRDKIKELRDEIEKLEAQKTPTDNLAMGVAESKSPVNCQVLVRGEIKDKGG